MKRYSKYKFIFLLIILLLVGSISYLMVEKSFGAFCNIGHVRNIISNVSTAFYDRGNYIQYDDSYLDNGKTIKRSDGFYYPEDANRDNIIYMDNVSFIANVFYVGLNYDIADTFGEISLQAMFNYGNGIYSKAVLGEDSRVNSSFVDSEDNSYVIDYYDDTVTKLTATMGEVDYHILTMYVNSSFVLEDIDKNNIYNKLVETLKVGDIIVYKDYVLLYVGKDIFMYCYGESYDYENRIDKVEDRAIKYGYISELNDSSSDKYLFSGDSFYVFRLGNNNLGFWTLPNHIYNNDNYFIDDEDDSSRALEEDVIYGTVPKLNIEKYGSVSEYDGVSVGEEITYTISVTNNTGEEIVIPTISDVIEDNVAYISNTYSEEAYSEKMLVFNNVTIEGNSSLDISYTVRVLDEEGIVVNDSTKIENYSLNSISYKIVKKDMDNSRIINNYQNYSSISSLYKKLYKIDLDLDNIWDNIVDQDGFYKEGYSLLINDLYGGVSVGFNSEIAGDRARYVLEDNLVMGDIVIYNDGIQDNYLLYVEEEEDNYLVSYDNDEVTKISDIDILLESLIGMDKFMVIRPSYIYAPLKDVEDKEIEFGSLEVLTEDMIILVKNTGIYEDIINEISNYDSIVIKNVDNIELSTSDIVKSGDSLYIDDKVYTIALLGDINGDGIVDNGDVLKLYWYVLKKTSITERYYLVSSYLNDDGVIDNGDLLKLYWFVLDKISGLS